MAVAATYSMDTVLLSKNIASYLLGTALGAMFGYYNPRANNKAAVLGALSGVVATDGFQGLLGSSLADIVADDVGLAIGLGSGFKFGQAVYKIRMKVKNPKKA